MSEFWTHVAYGALGGLLLLVVVAGFSLALKPDGSHAESERTQAELLETSAALEAVVNERCVIECPDPTPPCTTAAHGVRWPIDGEWRECSCVTAWDTEASPWVYAPQQPCDWRPVGCEEE